MSYFALDRDLLTSSLWAEAAPPTFKVWIYVLLVAKADGVVEDTLPALALHCGITKEEARSAVEFLSKPDEESRSKVREGRRLEQVETGGFRIVNYVERMKKDHSTPRVRRFRAHREGLANETPCNAPAFHETNEEGNQKHKPERTDERPDGPKRSPFLDSTQKRQDAEREALRICGEIAALDGRDGWEVMGEAAHYQGAQRQKFNPASMSDDRLLATLADLKATLAHLQAKPAAVAR